MWTISLQARPASTFPGQRMMNGARSDASIAVIEAIQQVATKFGKSLFPSLFTFRSRLTAVHHHSYYVFMTAVRVVDSRG
jgi:hypothetical protein